ncbi:MAG: CapA family protein [Cyclobacteriaceae bacterium]|nr:CapA family protein [Cyclobacteriaceae bacterium]
MKSTLTTLLLIILLSACKVQKPSTSYHDDTIRLEKDSLSTIKLATLDTLVKVEIDSSRFQDSVQIEVHRIIKDTIHIIGVGDIMMGTNFPNESYLPPNNGNYLFKDVEDILKNADVTFGNLEGVILNEGGTQKYCKNPKLCYLFRTPEQYMENLVNAGFDVMSTANNHAGDFGEEGRQSSMKLLDSVGIYHAGLLSQPYVTFKIDGMKYGFAAFSPNTGTSSIHNTSRAIEIIQHLDTISDIVIASFHGGAEGSKYQHVTRKTETFYGENRGNVYTFSHTLIDAGADVIFGHGPHVTRAIEIYKKRFIAYSLGNFCTYARFNLSGDNGLAPIVNVATNSSGEFLKASITPIVQYRPGGPKIDSQKRVIQRLIELTKKDFPEVPIKIDPSGIITYIEN